MTASWTADGTNSPERLDRHVARMMDQSRHQVHSWIEAGSVRVDGRVRKPSFPILSGMQIECDPPAAVESHLVPEAGELRVVFEDAHLLVLDKPAGLVVHPGAGRSEGTLVHRLLAAYPDLAGIGGGNRPGIVHRLDKDTTGLMVVARDAAALRGLARAFADRSASKRYVAIAYGAPRQTEGEISLPIGRHPERRKEMAVRTEGRPAVTRYRLRAQAEGVSWWDLDLRTGRTHQIRVHLRAIGHPLVGDPVYGEARWRGLHSLSRTRQAALRDFPRPALHAWKLSIRHPVTEETLQFEAAVPQDLLQLWQDATGLLAPAARDWAESNPIS